MTVIRLKYVNKFRNKNRADTRERYYFRVRGQKAISLPGEPGGEAFMAAYGAALDALKQQGKASPTGAELTAPGTVKALVISYYDTNDDWKHRFKQDTCDSRRRIINRFCDKYGGFRVRQFTTLQLVKIMNKRSTLSAKRNWLTTIKHLFGHAVPTMRRDNPLNAIERVKIPKHKPDGTERGHHSWTEDEVATYRAFYPFGTEKRLVMEFAYETVSRRGEVVNLGPQHCYVDKEGRRRIRIERTHGSEDVDIVMSDMLAAAIEAMPPLRAINGVVPLTFTKARGAPRKRLATISRNG